MRMKKFQAILNLLPESEELTKVKVATAEKIKKTRNIILKLKKYTRYIVEIYFGLSWILQTLGII